MLRDVLITKGLTPTEARVGELIAKGISIRNTAEALRVSESTIKGHITRIYLKFGVKSRGPFILAVAPFAQEEIKAEQRRQQAETEALPMGAVKL